MNTRENTGISGISDSNSVEAPFDHSHKFQNLEFRSEFVWNESSDFYNDLRVRRNLSLPRFFIYFTVNDLVITASGDQEIVETDD